MDSNTLTGLIAEMEAKVTRLMEQETQEKLEKQALENKLTELRTNSSSKLTGQLHQEHQRHMAYLDKRIANHEHTLQQFKDLYRSLTEDSHPSAGLVDSKGW